MLLDCRAVKAVAVVGVAIRSGAGGEKEIQCIFESWNGRLMG